MKLNYELHLFVEGSGMLAFGQYGVDPLQYNQETDPVKYACKRLNELRREIPREIVIEKIICNGNDITEEVMKVDSASVEEKMKWFDEGEREG